MFRIKRKISPKVCIALLPICMSLAPLSSRPVVGTAALCASIFLAVAFVPVFRHRENLVMFLLVWFCGIPINILLTKNILGFLELDSSVLNSIMYGVLIQMFLFSTEEIFFGVITRLCWRRQYKISFE